MHRSRFLLARLGAAASAAALASPVSHCAPSSRSTERPSVDAAAVNAAALSERALRLAQGRADAAAADDADEGGAARAAPGTRGAEALYLSRQAQGGAAARGGRGSAAVVYVRSVEDVASVDLEVAAFAITRSADGAAAQATLRALDAVAQADSTGATFYAVTDATPAAAVDFLRSALHTDLFADRAGGGSSAVAAVAPSIVVFDRAGATRNKFVMRSEGASDGDRGEAPPRASPSSSTAALDAPFSQPFAASLPADASLVLPQTALSPAALGAAAAVVDCAPLPSEIARFVRRVVEGEEAPTLLGRARPEGDRLALHPATTQVVGASWREIVLDPGRDVLLEAYLSHCPMCMCLAPRVRMLAQLAERHFPHVRVAVMNVDENDRPLEWMPGPAFPTIQLFNRGGASPRFTKQLGPACGNVDNLSGGTAMPAPNGRSARTTLAGTPPCVPAVDFSHPTAPGKMALPTVLELLHWVASHCSRPFDPHSFAVDRSEILDARRRFAELLGPELAADPAAPDEPQPPMNTLVSLAHDMDAEAKVLELAVFDLFYYERMASVAAGAGLGPRRLGPFNAKCVERLRRAATDAAGYGAGAEAFNAMGACADLAEELGVRSAARSASLAEAEQKVEDKAHAAVKSLV